MRYAHLPPYLGTKQTVRSPEAPNSLLPLDMNVLKVHSDDNVLVALNNLSSGTEVAFNGETYTLPEGVQAKHKFATRALEPGDPVIMYGVLVGKASRPIPRGGPLTTDNVKHATQHVEGRGRTATWSPPAVARWQDRHFLGYHRADGQVGTTNHWLVIPLVFCENRNVAVLREAFEKELGYGQPSIYEGQVAELAERYRQGASAEELLRLHRPQEKPFVPDRRIFPNVDGVRFLTHQGGCGGTRQDARTLCGLLAGYLHNPNVAGATVLSLGCQNAQMALLREEIEKRNPAFDKPLLFFEQQQYPSEYDMLSEAIRQTFVGMAEANRLERQPAPLSQLTLGVECGGSDGFSGISANPAIGHAADLVVALGGKVILSEFPELCGVEQELIDRCTSDVPRRTLSDHHASVRGPGRGRRFRLRHEPVAG